MASFGDILLGCPPVAAIIFGYQEGITEDALPYFDHFHEHVLYATPDGHHEAVFMFLNESGGVERLQPAELALLEQRDSRFPLHLVIYNGDLEATQRLVRGAPSIVSVDAIHCAFHRGRTAIAKYLLDVRARSPTLFESPSSSATTLDQAQRRVLCRYDDVELLKLFDAFASPTWSRDNCVMVFKHRRAHVAEYLYKHHEASWATLDVCTLASECGLTGILRLLAARGALTPRAIDIATQYGRADAVAFLRTECGQDVSNDVWVKVANSGLVRVLELLPVPADDEIVTAAAKYAAANGQLNVLGFLTSNSAVSLSGAVRAAVAAHRANVVDFVLALDPTVDVGFAPTHPTFLTCLLIAAQQGRHRVLEILFERKAFTPTRAIVDAAASSGSVELVTWLCTVTADIVTQTPSALALAVALGHIDVADVLMAHGLVLDAGTEIAGLHVSKLDAVLAFATEHRLPIAINCLHMACAKGLVDVVARLLPLFSPATAASMVDVAFGCSRPDVLRLLAQHGAPITPEMLLRALECDAWASFHVLCDLCPVTDAVLARAVRLATDDVARLQYVEYCLPLHPPSVVRDLVRSCPTLHVQLLATLLPACMHPNEPLDNLKFLIELSDAACKASNATFRRLLSFIAIEADRATCPLPASICVTARGELSATQTALEAWCPTVAPACSSG
ncbi:hypothetical protein SDRG_15681 [Saprolegnia diclina VS20]|uniref:Ankyrin repeat domain-containing protein n=1 Tax=Saprolegnia diclina (strain VS20) TaxID=1156394 RepID=T0R399_SAPDV|nr:hypothetical protein SDRG_15681 [Saprolegnia diclina VS20]EQC26503.1 hypothetical protein SDRG_15681 [Saprolegnia diclina VS20]|eukprot:XP_008620082.1 hypothetical protein SDRG_15681 [Saprolegnia diclina VS20]